MSAEIKKKKINVLTFAKMKQAGDKIAMLTAYDFTSAKILSNAGIDILLVGDSLGMVMAGLDNTLPVTLDEMIYHTKTVRRGAFDSFIVTDMPFGSYQVSIEDATKNAIRVIKESSADAIKLEGGAELAPLIKHLTTIGINVMAHIGLMPQKVHTMGGYKISGRDDKSILLADAKALEEAGAFSIVIEGTVAAVSKEITSALKIPTIGIGAGVGCDGQVLVYHDIFGLYSEMTPKFVKQYANAGEIIFNAAKEYIKDVKSSKFPADEHSFLK